MAQFVLTPMAKLGNDASDELYVLDGGRQIVQCDLRMAREYAKEMLEEHEHYEEVTIHTYTLVDIIH